jgi:hypothetical protein
LAGAILVGRHRLAADSPAADATTEELERIARQGREAMRRLAGANFRLVVVLAQRRRGRLLLSDAIRQGGVGLIRAIQRFDPRLGHQFSATAARHIRQAIDRAADEPPWGPWHPDQTTVQTMPPCRPGVCRPRPRPAADPPDPPAGPTAAGSSPETSRNGLY